MKDQIAKALTDLMKSKSYKSISIQMICKEASISRNTFYYHFKGKQELLEWICIRNYQKYCFPYHRFEESVLSSITIFDYIGKNRDFYKAIYKVDHGYLLHHCLMKAHISGTDLDHVREYTTLKNGSPKIDKEVYLHYAASGIASVIVYWVEKDFTIPVEKIAGDLRIMLTKSLQEVRNYYIY